jgi:hypothetical protein
MELKFKIKHLTTFIVRFAKLGSVQIILRRVFQHLGYRSRASSSSGQLLVPCCGR